MGSLQYSCAKVYELSELRFGVGRGVDRGIGGDAAYSQITLGNLVIIVSSISSKSSCIDTFWYNNFFSCSFASSWRNMLV